MIRILAMAAAVLTAIPGQARPLVSATDEVRARALAAKFDGTILIGDLRSGPTILTMGPNPVAPSAVWRWASITKQLTGVLVMQEVNRGRLHLDAPVSRYWPEWRSPGAARIRIRDLLRHNSGLPQPDESPADKDGIPSFYGAGAVAPADSAAGFCAGPLKRNPPAKFDYNNCDTIVLAEILRRITGKPFETLARERFARPLGMRHFGVFRFGQTPPAQVRPTGQDRQFEGKLDLGLNGASGAAYGTIADLWRFDRALLSGRLLPSAQREAMWKSERENGFYAFHQWVFPAKLKGCRKPVRVVERQGLIAGIEHRNYLLPESGRVLILFGRHRPVDYGDPWEGKGFAFDLLSAVACR